MKSLSLQPDGPCHHRMNEFNHLSLSRVHKRALKHTTATEFVQFGYMRIPHHTLSSSALLPFLHRHRQHQRPITTVARLIKHHAGQPCWPNDKNGQGLVVIMGATGTGKSKLSVDLSVEFSGEVVNSDKIQVYRGLDITTNKIPLAERRGVPHHLLGVLDPAAGELCPSGFRALATRTIAGISARRRVPVLAGGSNSFIHALLSARFDPRCDPFAEKVVEEEQIRFPCCFLWVHVQAAVLAELLDRRVDEMVAAGMVEELERYFAAEGAPGERHPGLGKAIGVQELREYFTGRGSRTATVYGEAVALIKANTRWLAEEQVRKIERLAAMGWPLRRLDATAAVAARLAGDETWSHWKSDVARPSVAAVERFLHTREGEIQLGNLTCAAHSLISFC